MRFKRTLTFTYLLKTHVYTGAYLFLIPMFFFVYFGTPFARRTQTTAIHYCWEYKASFSCRYGTVTFAKWYQLLSLVNRHVNHVWYSNIYGALIGSWKAHDAASVCFSVCDLLAYLYWCLSVSALNTIILTVGIKVHVFSSIHWHIKY